MTLEKSFFVVIPWPLFIGTLECRTGAPALRSAAAPAAFEEFMEGLISKESGGTCAVPWSAGSGLGQGGLLGVGSSPSGLMTQQARRRR